MPTKILMAYSSGYGATKEVSEEIAKIIAEEPTFDVVLKPVDDCRNIRHYEVIIVGTSVRADRPLANTRDFFAAHYAELVHKKLALFLVCLTASSDTGREKAKQEYLPQILSKYPQLKPVSVEAFGGKIDFDKLNPVMQNLVKNVMRRVGVPDTGSMDARNWQVIRHWAVDLTEKLRQALHD